MTRSNKLVSFWLAVAAILIFVGLAASGSKAAPYGPFGGVNTCYGPNFPSANVNCGSPPPNPSPTPTAWPHAPTMAYYGQFGGIGMSAAQCDANVTLAEYTIQNPGGVPPPINCTIGLGVLYFDVSKVDKSVGSGQVFDASSACTGSSTDNCHTHLVGAAPHNFDNPGCNTPGDRTTPSGCGGGATSVHGGNVCSALTTGWWYPYFQGTQTGITNSNLNSFWGYLSDDSTGSLFHSTKQHATTEIGGDTAWETCLYAFFNGAYHAASGPYASQQLNFITNSLQFGQEAINDGDVSCRKNYCLLQFGSQSPNVLLASNEFCIQNGSTGVGGGLFIKATFVPYCVNVATQVDALGRGMIITSEMECGTGGCASGAHDVDAPIADRMSHFATWFLAYDTNGLKAPNGESISVVSFEDFNNHTNNASSFSVFDEQFIEPIGDPNVQARPYFASGIPGSGLAGCGSASDLYGLADYLLAGTCAAALNGVQIGVYEKCYHHFSYHDIAYGDICVLINLRNSDYTIQSGDIPAGYTVTHTYLPNSACTDTPNCGDAVTGGTSNSQCTGTGAPACLGNLTAGTFTAGLTVVTKNGGVQVLTP